MEINVRINSINADGKKVGWFLFPPSTLFMRIYGKSLTFVANKSGDISILQGRRIRAPVAVFSKDVLEYGSEKYRLDETKIGESQATGLTRMSDGALMAASRGNGSMNMKSEMDAILTGFCVMALCLIREAGHDTHKIVPSTEMMRMMFSPGRKTARDLSVLMLSAGTALFVLLAQVIGSGFWTKLLIAGYAAVMIGTIVLLISSTYRNRTLILRHSE